MPLMLKEGRNEGWMNFPRGEGEMTDGSRADTGRPSERAADNATWRQGRDKRISRGTRGGKRPSSEICPRPARGTSFPCRRPRCRLVVISPIPHARARRPECRCKVAQLRTDTEERNVGLPACHSTLRSGALILLHNNNRLISRALTSKMRRSERHLSSMR